MAASFYDLPRLFLYSVCSGVPRRSRDKWSKLTCLMNSWMDCIRFRTSTRPGCFSAFFGDFGLPHVASNTRASTGFRQKPFKSLSCWSDRKDGPFRTDSGLSPRASAHRLKTRTFRRSCSKVVACLFDAFVSRRMSPDIRSPLGNRNNGSRAAEAKLRFHPNQ
jgi:hypothetical protein